MAISVGTVFSYNSDIDGVANDYAFTVDCGSGENRLLLLFYGSANWAALDTQRSPITYADRALSLCRAVTASFRDLALFYLKNPPTGSNTLNVWHGGGGNEPTIVSAIPLSGVDLTKPIVLSLDKTGTGNPIFSTVSGKTNDLIIEGLFTATTGGGWDVAASAGQTVLTDYSGSQQGGSARNFVTASKAAATPITIVSWNGTQMGGWTWFGLTLEAYQTPKIAVGARIRRHW